MTTFTTQDRLEAQHATSNTNPNLSSSADFPALPEGLDPIPYEEKYKDYLKSSS